MECAFEAQNLISISLRKIQSSRTQRGGIKLHKNLLVTYVLRNARQFYVGKNLPPTPRTRPAREDASAARPQQRHERLQLSGGLAELADDFYCNFTGVESDTWHQPGAEPPPPPPQCQDAAACVMLPPGDSDPPVASEACWSSCCADKSPWEAPVPNPQAHQKTVLDLDTHVVTTVTNGYFHSDCCAPSKQPQGAQCHGKRRRLDAMTYPGAHDPDFYLQDFGPVPACKRMRTEDESPQSDQEQRDSSNLSTLISVLGSGGLSEFVSWQQTTDLEQMFSAQTISLKHTLLAGSGWTRAIEAF